MDIFRSHLHVIECCCLCCLVNLCNIIRRVSDPGGYHNVIPNGSTPLEGPLCLGMGTGTQGLG